MSKTIWVVDDDAGILEVTKIVLEEAKFHVVCIDNEGEFFSKLETTTPHLVLLDLSIGGSGGKEIAKKVKANNATKDVPILLLSANNDIEQITKEAGADGFIRKPYDIEELVKEVDKFVN